MPGRGRHRSAGPGRDPGAGGLCPSHRDCGTAFAERIRKAEIIEKEKPFYTYIKAKDIYENDSEENILVQGIIDLYYKEKDGNIVLVDYKTDYFENDNELISKYKIQLNLYKKALENSLNVKIKDVYIYSISQNREIKII